MPVIQPRPRVFVSSVMEDYGGIRDAASRGIRDAGCEPVRAEDFSAASVSPRNACLDGVCSADALVLLLGGRYGFLGPSGLAATEEEYDEARRHHKHILVFLQRGVSREPQQQAFVNRVQDYVDGHWRKVFDDSEDLSELVRAAVTAAELAQVPGHQRKAEARIQAALNRRPPETRDVVWLQTVWTTLRDEEVVDPLDLGEGAFQRRVQRVAHECESPLFTYEESKRLSVEISLLRVEQGDFDDWSAARDIVVVEIHTDGTLVTVQNVTGTEPRSHDLVNGLEMYFLDPDIVRARLSRAWSFVAAWWTNLDPYSRHEPLVYSVALYDVGSRGFSVSPGDRRNVISLPPEFPENPLVLLDKPRQVSRAILSAPSAETKRIVTLLERRFEQRPNRW